MNRLSNPISVAHFAVSRLQATALGQECLQQSPEIVIFGSRSVGLERPDSDIDILCFSNQDLRFKSDFLDLIVMANEARGSRLWLGSELASHIAEYGTWIKGSGSWCSRVRIDDTAIDAKRRRISAFLRALPELWGTLAEDFRVKYSIKLRRETQRLLLMERGKAVPPTKILDKFWDRISISPLEVANRLRQFSTSCNSSFPEDLFERIDRAFSFAHELDVSCLSSRSRCLRSSNVALQVRAGCGNSVHSEPTRA